MANPYSLDQYTKPKKDIYSYEYLSKPFELNEDTLPPINSSPDPQSVTAPNNGSNMSGLSSSVRSFFRGNTGGGSEGKGIFKGKNSQLYGQAALAGATMLNESSRNNKYQTDEDKSISKVGTGVASAIGPWWGAAAQAGEYTSKELKGDGRTTARSAAGNISDPWNLFKGNRKEKYYYQDGNKSSSLQALGGNTALGNFAVNNLTGKGFWDALSGRTAKKERNYQDRMKTLNTYNQVNAVQQQNNLHRPDTQYKALPYGKNGMKIRTKLSTY